MGKTDNINNPNRIKAPEAIFFNSLGRMGITAAGAMISSYMLLFYVKCGMNLAVLATIFLVAKLFDAFNDVFMAFFFDRIPKDKFGRLKVISIICVVVFSINFLFLWLGPYWAIGNLSFQYTIVWISYILYGIAISLVEIPYNMFSAIQTEDDKQRANRAPLMAIGQILGGVVITMILPHIITSVQKSTGGNDMPAYVYAVIIVVAINLVISPIGILACKKRVNTIQSTEKIKFLDFLACVKVKEVFITCACQIGVTGGISIVYSTIVFYSEYVMEMGQSVTGMVNTLSGIGIFPWLIFGSLLMKKFYKKNLILAGLGFTVAMFILRMLMPTEAWWIYLIAGLTGIGTGVLMVVLPVMTIECNEIAEYKIGRRAEATIGAINTFFVKIGNTLAVILPAFILSRSGFDTNLASFSAMNPEEYISMYGSLYVPSSQATGAIIFCTHLLPAIFYFIAFVLILFWNHTKSKHDVMMVELNERRDKLVNISQ